MTENFEIVLLVCGYILVFVVLPIIWLARVQKNRKAAEADPSRAEEVQRRHERGKRFESAINLAIASAFVLAGLWTLTGQCYTYLRAGEWNSKSVIDLMISFESTWALAPADWIGLHHMLDWIPLSLALIFTGVIIAGASD